MTAAFDFDRIAAELSGSYRVVCPDVAGRGDSEWLPDPMLYQLPQYLSDMVALVARLDVEQVDWLGHIRLDVPNYRAALDWAFEHGEPQYAARIAGAQLNMSSARAAHLPAHCQLCPLYTPG